MSISVSLSVCLSLLTRHSYLYVPHSSSHQIPPVPQTSWPHTFSLLPPWKEWHHFALVVVVWSAIQAEAPLQPSLLLLYVCWRLLLMCLLWLGLGGCMYFLKCWFQKQVSTATNWAETAVVFLHEAWFLLWFCISLQKCRGSSRMRVRTGKTSLHRETSLCTHSYMAHFTWCLQKLPCRSDLHISNKHHSDTM